MHDHFLEFITICIRIRLKAVPVGMLGILPRAQQIGITPMFTKFHSSFIGIFHLETLGIKLYLLFNLNGKSNKRIKGVFAFHKCTSIILSGVRNSVNNLTQLSLGKGPY